MKNQNSKPQTSFKPVDRKEFIFSALREQSPAHCDHCGDEYASCVCDGGVGSPFE